MSKKHLLFVGVFVMIFSFVGTAFCERAIYVPPPKDSPGEVVDDKSDVVILTNQDKLSGEVIGTDGKGGIVVKHPLLGADVTVPIPSARSIAFGGRREHRAQGQDSVLITNGDSLTGVIEGLMEESFIVKTDYAGALQVNRCMVASISLGSGGRVVLNEDFSGGMEGWVPHGGVWAVSDESLSQTRHGSHYVSYKVNQTGPMTFEWVMSSMGSNYVNAGAAIFCSGTNSMYGDDSYYVFLSGNTIYVYRVRNRNTSSVANKHMRSTIPSARCRVEYDPDSGKLAFTLNDEVVASYTDASPLKKGSYFLLCASQPARFDNVRIMRGTGRLGAERGGAEEEDIIFFSNGDRTSGSVESISRGQLAMKTLFGAIKVDLDKVDSVEFNAKNLEEPRRRAGDTAVVLTNHDRLTIQLDSLDEAALSGYMGCVGEIAIQRQAVRGVSFHIYEK